MSLIHSGKTASLHSSTPKTLLQKLPPQVGTCPPVFLEEVPQ